MEADKEFKERTKLDKEDIFFIIACCILIIGCICLMIIEKIAVWGLVALAWGNIATNRYFDTKIRKAHILQEETLWNIINTQAEIINNLSERDEE